MRYLMSCMLICLVVGTVVAAGGQQRERICLSGSWLLHRGGEPDAIPADAWAATVVPGKFAGWYGQESYLLAHGPIAWYKTGFIVPMDWDDGRQLRLRFEGVSHYCRIYVNQQFVGEHRSVFVPFEVDITSAANIGVNELAVYVVSPEAAADGYPIGHAFSARNVGIVDDVYLVSYPQVYVSDVFVMPSVREMDLGVQITFTNNGDTDQEANVYSGVFLEGEKKLIMPEERVTVPAGETVRVELSQPWADPELWGYGEYGSPILYAFKTHIVLPNGTTDTRFDRFGFREFWCEGNEFRLNGKPIFLTGDCYSTGMGFAYPNNRHFLNIFLQAERQMNVNNIRLGWEPRRRVWFEVADEVGMLLEVNVNNSLPGVTWDQDRYKATGNLTEGYVPDETGEQTELVSSLIRQYVRAHRNHPSIIIWESNNEAGTQGHRTPPVQSLTGLAAIQKICHEVDPTRPVDPQGSPWVAAAPRLGIDFETDIYNVHPYGRPLYIDYTRIGRMVGFRDDRPQIIGEVVRNTDEIGWGMSGRTPDQIKKAFEAYDEHVGKYWAESALDYHRRGGDGFQVLTLGAFAYHGPKSETEFAGGPWNIYAGGTVKDPPCEWPAYSGEDFKVAGLQIGALYGNLNWWDPALPAFTLNCVADRMKAAYAEIAGGDLPALPKRRRPEVIVTVTANDIPVPDRYVTISPGGGQAVPAQTVRTDWQGRAWFVLDEPGSYEIIFAEETARFVPRKTIQVDWAARDTQAGYHFIQYFDLPLPVLLEIPEQLTQPLNVADTEREQWLERAQAAAESEQAEAAAAEEPEPAAEAELPPRQREMYSLHRAPENVAIDGNGEEWADYPGIELGMPEQLVAGRLLAEDWQGRDDCSGVIKVAWDDQYIYYFALIHDDKPRVMLPDASAHLGDSVELYIGFGGVRDTKKCDEKVDFQFIFNAGSPEVEPFVFWGRKPPNRELKCDIAVGQPEAYSGYNVEARIELASIGVQVPATASEIGFNVAINDADNIELLRETKLDWAQDVEDRAWNWPCVWNKALVLPAPEPKPEANVFPGRRFYWTGGTLKLSGATYTLGIDGEGRITLSHHDNPFIRTAYVGFATYGFHKPLTGHGMSTWEQKYWIDESDGAATIYYRAERPDVLRFDQVIAMTPSALEIDTKWTILTQIAELPEHNPEVPNGAGGDYSFFFDDEMVKGLPWAVQTVEGQVAGQMPPDKSYTLSNPGLATIGEGERQVRLDWRTQSQATMYFQPHRFCASSGGSNMQPGDFRQYNINFAFD